MGMNMVSKATEFTLKHLKDEFPDMEIITISSNMCTDKKPSAINWIMGRGKSVVAEALIPKDIVEKTLKTTASHLVDLNDCKNKTGMFWILFLSLLTKINVKLFIKSYLYSYRISLGWKYRRKQRPCRKHCNRDIYCYRAGK
jgi:hypothetical protein